MRRGGAPVTRVSGRNTQWAPRSPPLNHLFCWISQNAAGLTAIFTFIYLVFTILIFNEARKSADAAKTSADAAAGSVALMSKEIDQQAIRRQTIVRTYVEAAIKTIGDWN